MNNESKENLMAHLAVDEGFVGHVYPDSLGYLTIGFGRLVDKRKGGGITREEGLYLLNNDVERHWSELTDRLPWVLKLDEVRQVALGNLAFNLGVDGLLKFKNTLAAVKRGDWEAAAHGLRTSLWFRQVQPSRSSRLIYMVRTGAYPDAEEN